MALKLNDILRIKEEDVWKVRVKFNVHSGWEHPLDVYKTNPELINTQWLLWRSDKKYYPNEGILAVSLIPVGWDLWLLTTVKRITKILDVTDDIGYEGEELTEYKSLYGRLVVKYHKSTRQGVRTLNSVADELIVHELLPDMFEGDEFAGYDNVRLSYDQLRRIVVNQKRDWKAALENQKAVYLITDMQTGKLYVGSATSENGMLLARWSSYVENGHGGNVGLIELINREGFEYVQRNFMYSILENYNAKVDDHVILSRESWWKETLGSRIFGYNKN